MYFTEFEHSMCSTKVFIIQPKFASFTKNVPDITTYE
jgi:hypothetical protein